jgi:hypothetical protein
MLPMTPLSSKPPESGVVPDVLHLGGDGAVSFIGCHLFGFQLQALFRISTHSTTRMGP